jgi:hypothetical protein
LTFKVIIMDAVYSQRYHQYESDKLRVNEFLDRHLAQIKVNTPIDTERVILISKRESLLDFDMELIVEFTDTKRGFIKPGYTSCKYYVDQTREMLNLQKLMMFSHLYQEEKAPSDRSLSGTDLTDSGSESMPLADKMPAYAAVPIACTKDLEMIPLIQQS